MNIRRWYPLGLTGLISLSSSSLISSNIHCVHISLIFLLCVCVCVCVCVYLQFIWIRTQFRYMHCFWLMCLVSLFWIVYFSFQFCYSFLCVFWDSVIQFSSIQLLNHVWLSVTPWIATRQASLSITNSRSSPKPIRYIHFYNCYIFFINL